MLPKTIPIVTTLALSAGGALLAGSAVDAAGSTGVSALATATTNYGFAGQAFGTRVRRGALPANSGRTALAILGCTRTTGLIDTNSLASVKLGGALGTAHGIKSETKTYRANGSLNVRSVNTIARLGKANSLLEIRGIRAVARVWHDANGFHRSSRATVGGVFSLGVRQRRHGGVIKIPGVATLTLHSTSGAKSLHRASVNVTAVRIDVALTDTTAVLGNARASINDGLVTGVLGKVGISADGSVLRHLVRTGQVARQPLPCQGTNGVWRTNQTAAVTVNDLIHLGAATASARGDQLDRTHGYAQTRGRVARATVGAKNQLVIKGVVGAANVHKKGTRLIKSARGTHILSITFNGRNRRIPTVGRPLKVGTLAVLSVSKAKRTKYGISVVALHVKLLRGTLTDIDLGVAKASIRP